MSVLLSSRKDHTAPTLRGSDISQLPTRKWSQIMCIKKIFICVLASFFFLGFTGAVMATDFDHSMKFTNTEINVASSMVSPMYVTVNATEVGDSMKFTSDEIDSISSMDSSIYVTDNSANFGDSMTFTSTEIDSIGPVNRVVICTQNC